MSIVVIQIRLGIALPSTEPFFSSKPLASRVRRIVGHQLASARQSGISNVGIVSIAALL